MLVIIIAAIASALGAGGPFAGIAIIGCGLVVLRGIIMVPVGLYRSAKATARISAIRSSLGQNVFSEKECWEMISAEGLRIIECLEENKRGVYGCFVLPQGIAKNPGMGESSLSWGILPKKQVTVQQNERIEP